MEQRGLAGLLALVADRAITPVDVFSGQLGDVPLRGAQMPEQFVKRLILPVAFSLHDVGVFREGDGAFRFELDRRPLPLGDHRPSEPVHVQGEVLQSAQEDVRRHGSDLEHVEEVLGLGLEDAQVPDGIESMVFHSAVPTIEGRSSFGLQDCVHRGLPGSLGDLGIAGGQVCPG